MCHIKLVGPSNGGSRISRSWSAVILVSHIIVYYTGVPDCFFNNIINRRNKIGGALVDIEFQIDSGFEVLNMGGYILYLDSLFFQEEFVIVEVEDEESEGVRNFVVFVISLKEVPE